MPEEEKSIKYSKLTRPSEKIKKDEREKPSRFDFHPIQRHLFIPVIIGILFFLFLKFLSSTKVIKFLEYRTYDWRVILRNRRIFSNIQAPSHYRNPKIVVVPVDNKSFEEIKDPTFFWVPYYVDVLNHLIDNGAAVIALDYQFKINPDEYLKARVMEIFSKFLKDNQINIKNSDIEKYIPNNLQAFFLVLRKKKVVLMTILEEEGKAGGSFENFMWAAGRDNWGLVSNEPDEDGFTRKYLLYKDAKIPGHDRTQIFSFSLVTASKMLNAKIDYDEKTNKFKLGDVILPHDENFKLIINYIRHPGYFTREYSFADLVKKAKENDNEYFRKNFCGKAVLIGPGYSGSTDLILTPYNIGRNLEMFGVECHANALNTILNHDFIYPLPGFLNSLILLIVGILISILCYYLKPHYSAVACFIIGSVFIMTCFFVLYRYNIWMNMASPLMIIPLTFGAVYAYRYVAEDKEKRFIRSLLGRYISEQVAEEILNDPSKLELGGKRTEVTVLFCDINDFTTYSEKTSPEDVILILNEYFTRMERIIFENRGTLKQFIGDEIMVISGAPQPDPEHATRICNIAIKMLEGLRQWQKERTEAGKFVFDVKFGIHSGPVVAGNVGSPHRTEYTTVGDVVNTTSRIMSLTKNAKVNILISEETYQIVKDRFEVRDKGSFPVKGREQEVRVYELVGIKK